MGQDGDSIKRRERPGPRLATLAGGWAVMSLAGLGLVSPARRVVSKAGGGRAAPQTAEWARLWRRERGCGGQTTVVCAAQRSASGTAQAIAVDGNRSFAGGSSTSR